MIFTYMEISDAHMQRIVEVGEEREDRDSDSNTEREDRDSSWESEGGGSDSSAESSWIKHYTKPYDYMNAEDREEIIEFLIWLGLQ